MTKEKRSKNYYDVLKWIEKCINSCETYQQLVKCTKLVKNFQKTYSSDKSFNVWDIHNLFEIKHQCLSKISKRLNNE